MTCSSLEYAPVSHQNAPSSQMNHTGRMEGPTVATRATRGRAKNSFTSIAAM